MIHQVKLGDRVAVGWPTGVTIGLDVGVPAKMGVTVGGIEVAGEIDVG